MNNMKGWICLQSQTLPNWPRPSALILVRSFDSICCRLLGISRAASWTSCHLPEPVHSPVAIPLPTISLDQASFTSSPIHPCSCETILILHLVVIHAFTRYCIHPFAHLLLQLFMPWVACSWMHAFVPFVDAFICYCILPFPYPPTQAFDQSCCLH